MNIVVSLQHADWQMADPLSDPLVLFLHLEEEDAEAEALLTVQIGWQAVTKPEINELS